MEQVALPYQFRGGYSHSHVLTFDTKQSKKLLLGGALIYGIVR